MFALFQLPDYLVEFRFYFIREVSNRGPIILIVGVLLTGIRWLTMGLMAHLFIRGIWVGLVGLSYVFPNGIQVDKLQYVGRFQKMVGKAPTLEEQIENLEKLGSSLFSVSYFAFMCLLGFMVYFGIAAVVPVMTFLSFFDFTREELSQNIYPIANTYALVVLGIGGIYLIDFLTLGPLKKWRWSSKIYYPLYRVISLLTLSPFYRNVYYILISNIRKWKIILFIALFLLTSFMSLNLNSKTGSLSWNLSRIEFFGYSEGTTTNPESYDSFNHKSAWKKASIQSDIIKDDVLRVFVTHEVRYEDSLKAICNRENLDWVNSDSAKLVAMEKFYLVNVDDSIYQNQKWIFFNEVHNGHRGVLTYVDISDLDKGMHQVKITLDPWYSPVYDIIPFYKE